MHGTVRLRPANMRNKQMNSGEIEIDVSSFKILNLAPASLPIDIRSTNLVRLCLLSLIHSLLSFLSVLHSFTHDL